MLKKYGIAREQYKNIKKMDHKKMETFMVNLYNEGFNDGKHAADTKRVKPSDIAVAISEVKGVGTKKVTEIMTTINELFFKN